MSSVTYTSSTVSIYTHIRTSGRAGRLLGPDLMPEASTTDKPLLKELLLSLFFSASFVGMRQRSELERPPKTASEAELTSTARNPVGTPVALTPLMSTPSERSCGVPNQHLIEGHLQLRLLAGKQDPSQQWRQAA